MKKILALASSKTLNWEYVPLFVSKAMNQTITPRTGFAPIVMVMGKSKHTESFLDLEPLFPMHHSIKGFKEDIEKINNEITKMCELAQQNIHTLREETHNVVNKNRIDKKLNLKKEDIVFVLDRYNLPGNSRPLKTTFLPSPYVVIEPYYTTTLVERLADKFRTLISNDDLKKFNPELPNFVESLPQEVLKILVNKYSDLIQHDIRKIAENDSLKIPPGVNLLEKESKDSKPFSPIVRGRAPSGPENIISSPSPPLLLSEEEDYEDDFVEFNENERNERNVNNVNNVQQAFNQPVPKKEDQENTEDRNSSTEVRRTEDSRDLQLRGRKVTFDLP
jgi:hypothetical protein